MCNCSIQRPQTAVYCLTGALLCIPLHHLFSLSFSLCTYSLPHAPFLSQSVCLFEVLSDDAVCIVQLESACRAGYIISCNTVTSHTRLPHLLMLELQSDLQRSHVCHRKGVVAVLSASRKVTEKGQVAVQSQGKCLVTSSAVLRWNDRLC